jgi:DNA-directed RNA polymerase sigma subunit (sigma70/sigma32)
MAKVTKQYTNRESQSLDKYLQEIGKVELLKPEEEIDLARRIRKGDQRALEKLTKANLRFVVSVAKQYQNQGLSLGDLSNEGNLGLIKAETRFDETRGFSSFRTRGGGSPLILRRLRLRVWCACPTRRGVEQDRKSVRTLEQEF